MKPGSHDPDGFDHGMRQLHATALEQVSPRVRARLRAARHATTNGQDVGKRSAWPWLAASFASAVLAVVIGVQWLPGTASAPGSGPQVAAVDGSAPGLANADGVAMLDQALGDQAMLDENPEFYLWLASSEAELFAME